MRYYFISVLGINLLTNNVSNNSLMSNVNSPENNATHSAFSCFFNEYIFRFVVSLAYFGLLKNTENLSGSIFLNFFFGALVEVPALLSCIFLLDRFGRKKLYISFIVTGGICAIITIFPLMYAAEGKIIHFFFFSILSKLVVLYILWRVKDVKLM